MLFVGGRQSGLWIKVDPETQRWARADSVILKDAGIHEVYNRRTVVCPITGLPDLEFFCLSTMSTKLALAVILEGFSGRF